jgi:hypothetical protein
MGACARPAISVSWQLTGVDLVVRAGHVSGRDPDAHPRSNRDSVSRATSAAIVAVPTARPDLDRSGRKLNLNRAGTSDTS